MSIANNQQSVQNINQANTPSVRNEGTMGAAFALQNLNLCCNRPQATEEEIHFSPLPSVTPVTYQEPAPAPIEVTPEPLPVEITPEPTPPPQVAKPPARHHGHHGRHHPRPHKPHAQRRCIQWSK